MSLITQANQFFNDKLFQEEFIRSLESKGYLKKETKETKETKKLVDDFIQCLYKKKYITKKSFIELTGDSPNQKLDEKVYERKTYDFESIKDKDDTYEIIHEDYIDYDNIQIDGIEYYLHKISLIIVDSSDFGDMGVWSRDLERPEWKSDEEETKHLLKVGS